jgi:hypothetical protein
VALVLCSASDSQVWLPNSTDWKPFGSFIQKPGQSVWLGHGYLTARHIYPTNLLAHWQSGEKKPWCLATNLPDRNLTLLTIGAECGSKRCLAT